MISTINWETTENNENNENNESNEKQRKTTGNKTTESNGRKEVNT